MAFNRWSTVIHKTISNSCQKNWFLRAAPSSSASCNWSRSLCENNASSSSSSSPSLSSYHIGGGPSYMRGVVFWEPNKPLSIEEFRIPRPKAGEILIKTKGKLFLRPPVYTSCGVCHSDLHVIKGELPFASPCVVGHEITGEVVEHGPMTDTRTIERFPIGAHVVGAFIMPCGSCFFCSKGQDDLCEDFFAYNRAKGTLYDGETRLFLRDSDRSKQGVTVIPKDTFLLEWICLEVFPPTPSSTGKPIYMYSMGGLAEYCVVPAHGLCVLPDTLPYTESAILGCAVFTAYGAMAHAAEVRPGDTVAVIGIGGVGSSCLQIARAFGASEIIAVDVQDDKLQKAKTLGATHTINSRNEDAVEKIREITGGRGVDVAVEALGKPQTFLQCTQSVRDGGKAVMIGLTDSSARGEVDINRLVRRQRNLGLSHPVTRSSLVKTLQILTAHDLRDGGEQQDELELRLLDKVKIIGSYGGRARQDLPKLVKLAESGIFNLSAAVSRTCQIEDANEIYQDLNRGSIIGRAVVEIM
ncbi:hypothetical protein RHMOL_Rhmol09G0062300 [Rhododendron molle]|uniref:Uncharacterized protein n=2 Tax=Rhododendron molle TaxID=49168 RepID=A0ACC0MAL0_RHOML|nr:hypothetical protein RHMOL_Rhmol09G0062300 [Rhododendron molle]KAI8537929.1 hypothetical protein RHMOL_Rhmol09G0062300 [Rhododendron molle]